MTEVTTPASVSHIGEFAFASCTNLTKVFFHGDAPILDVDAFKNCDKATIYYKPRTKGWDETFGGRPTKLWEPEEKPVLSNDLAQELARRAAQDPFPPAPSLELEQAVQIANSHLKEKKVDTSDHYLDNARLLQSSSWMEGKKSWIIVWKRKVRMHGNEIFIFVGMDKSVRLHRGI